MSFVLLDTGEGDPNQHGFYVDYVHASINELENELPFDADVTVVFTQVEKDSTIWILGFDQQGLNIGLGYYISSQTTPDELSVFLHNLYGRWGELHILINYPEAQPETSVSIQSHQLWRTLEPWVVNSS